MTDAELTALENGCNRVSHNASYTLAGRCLTLIQDYRKLKARVEELERQQQPLPEAERRRLMRGPD